MKKNSNIIEKIISDQKGQALVSLLAFVAMGMIITGAAVTMTVINAQASGKFVLAEEALRVAEAGAENAILRLLRDPNFSGETLTLGNSSAEVVVTGGGTKTIVSTASSGSIRKVVTVVGSFSNNVFTITSWTNSE